MRILCTLFLGFILALTPVLSQNQSITSPVIESKIDSLLDLMSIQEKVGQTCQITLDVLLERDSAGGVKEPVVIDPKKVKTALVDYCVGSVLNVGSHTLKLDQWKHIMQHVHGIYADQKSKIPIIYGIDAIHGVNYTVGSTLFPQEIGLAATWNPSLALQFGEVTAYETRASGIHWNFSPVLDLGRQPLWSRTFETLGEDPLLASVMGKAIINGYQGQRSEGMIDDFHVASCMKHFVGYSNPMSGRDRTPAWIPDKYMKELYLPSFKAAVDEGALTVMINSGVVNGVPGHQNYHLLTEVLKEEWGFEGFAVSDWEDFIMLHSVHRTAKSIKEGIVLSMNAGLDMSMVPSYPQYQEYCRLMLEAVNEGSIPIERLDDAVKRILRVKMILGLFNSQINQDNKYSDFASKLHQQIAYQSALESITLLKNDDILPLQKDQKVLVSGPTSDNLIFLNGAWTHTWQGDNVKFNTQGRLTIREELEQNLGAENCLFSQGAELYNNNGYEATRLVDIEDFKSKAEKSDVILLCLGEYPSTEKPGDIRSLNINPEQIELAKIAQGTGKPVVLVLVEGRPRIIRDAVENSSAIVQAYLPGDFGAKALSQLLFGEANFSGKLPYSYPKYDGQIEFYDHPRSVDRHKSNGFTAYDPQWDFGFGLSYTNFEYSNLSLDKSEISHGDSIIVSVTIENTGGMDGMETVQMYISDHFATVVPNGKSLKSFDKISLKAGELTTIQFVISHEDMEFVNAEGNWVSEPGLFSVSVGGLTKDYKLK
ncbi:MAG: beta-glucosidase [Flavobacteriales bacterium]|jgi:beta-glucosidase|nr:beta-glucosidase [Flavobacteriales bacterium]